MIIWRVSSKSSSFGEANREDDEDDVVVVVDTSATDEKYCLGVEMEVMREDDDVGEKDWQPIVNRMVVTATDDIVFIMLLLRMSTGRPMILLLYLSPHVVCDCC